jgi:hypothetical protein
MNGFYYDKIMTEEVCYVLFIVSFNYDKFLVSV